MELEELFRRCDTKGSGHIGREELRALCVTFGIGEGDADAIFLDLDHDGDGLISLGDFTHGFRDFLTPGSRRGSLQTEEQTRLEEMQRRHESAIKAWRHLSKHVDNQAGMKSLIQEVERLEEEYRNLEMKFAVTRQSHANQLAALGDELDAQLARAKEEAKAEALKHMECQRRLMEGRLGELSSQLQEWRREKAQEQESLKEAFQELKSRQVEQEERMACSRPSSSSSLFDDFAPKGPPRVFQQRQPEPEPVPVPEPLSQRKEEVVPEDLSLADSSCSSPDSGVGREESGVPVERAFKVILAGEAGVGKSTWIERICRDEFVPNLSSTIGVDFRVKSLQLGNRKVVVQLWDTAGQERFRSLTKNYFRKADGVVLLYDVGSEASFIRVREWVSAVHESNGSGRIPILICGNKCDLPCRAVSRGQGEEMAYQMATNFMETSPKTGENVMEALILLAKWMTTEEDAQVLESIRLQPDSNKKKKGCC